LRQNGRNKNQENKKIKIFGGHFNWFWNFLFNIIQVERILMRSDLSNVLSAPYL
jgi:hypothetical protein